jgi:release factor glutamine methyltransferase
LAESATVREALRQGRDRLRAGNIEDAELEAEVLLRHVLDFDRAGFLQRLADPIDATNARRFDTLIARRLDHEPSAYITGHREFYGRDFLVTPDVLIPRPDTETLIEAAMEIAGAKQSVGSNQPVSVVDVGTGSGAIAITLALELPDATLYATDTSPKALQVARSNAERLGASGIMFLRGDLLARLVTPVDLLIANLPYVPAHVVDRLEPEVRDHEPRLALDGGADGLDLIRRLLQQAPSHLKPGGAVLLEVGFDQAEAVSALALAWLPDSDMSVRNDLARRPRVLIVRRR